VAPLLITDVVDWKKDPATGDLVVPIQYVAGLEGIAQRISTAIQMTRGEWAFDRLAGMPWIENDYVDAFTAILARPFSDQRVRAELRRIILGIEGVHAITSLAVVWDGENRTASVAWAVDTIWGVPASATTEVQL
jgi:hypothetical protein